MLKIRISANDQGSIRTYRMAASALVVLILLFSGGAGAQLRLPADGLVEQVKEHALVRPDPSKTLDPADLMTSDAGFSSFDPKLNQQSGPVWLKLKLKVSPNSSGRYVLRVSRRFFQAFDLYAGDVEDAPRAQTATFNRATDAAIIGRNYVFDFAARPGEVTELLLFVDTVQGSLQPLELWIQDANSFSESRSETLLVLGLTFGVLLALIFHNFVLYLNLGQRGHLYYVLAMISLLLLLGADSGLLQNYLLPDALQPHAIRLNALFPVLVLITIGLFFQVFVYSERTLPRLNVLVRLLLAVLGAGALALVLVPSGQLLILATMLQLVLVTTLFVLLVGGFVAGRRGSPEGYIFIAAWGLFVISGVARSLMSLDVISRVTVFEYLIYFGAVMEAVILALGLSYRVRQLYNRHARALEEQHKAARLANLDPLTNAYNRRFLQAYLENVMPDRPGASFDRALLILDLDNFKQANDAHGHAAGDAILRELVRRCRQVIRESDVLCRLGGDEFVIVLSDQRDRSAMSVAGRLVEVIGDQPFEFEGESITVTTSIGVVSSISPSSQVGEVLRMADQALYQAKRAGRDRATMFDPDQDSPFRHGASLNLQSQEQS